MESDGDYETGAVVAEATVEDVYQMKTQLEHILLRPDTYVGSVEKVSQPMWVFNPETKGLEYRQITFVPALYKIFDEILVNAADNKQRDPKMNSIKVTIDQSRNVISVWNNGKGIPVVVHKEHKIYVPDMIFGHLLTSSNYNDNIKKVTGGRNGYGAKLTNIFSKRFRIETVDHENGKYVQEFSNNMSEKTEPHITSAKSLKDYTQITFSPDLSRFGMETLEDDTVHLMMKRVYDIAGVSKVKVFLNEEQVPLKSFQDYVHLYKRLEDPEPIFTKLGDRWEVSVGLSDGTFNQVSFVNSICTTKGGQHVLYLADQVTEHCMKVLERTLKKDKTVKPNHIRNYLYIFVNCLIENPAFDSQTKETLTTRSKDFGSSPVLPSSFMDKVCKNGLTEAVLSWAKFKQTNELKKKGGNKTSRLIGVEKLDDANFAGSKHSIDCTLILTEGDSAKTLAVSGLSVVGRDYYGVFPLRGKLLNVRDASHDQIMKNMEIQNIVKIMGLKYACVTKFVGQEYQDVKSLRYGSIIIMSDQDYDGSHIKGLVVNFIHHFWPSLIKINGFLKQFITPIVKVSKGGAREEVFFTIADYEAWMESHPDSARWTIKYYKGLGTSTAKEAKEYFSNLVTHLIPFEYTDSQDDQCIVMAFEKKKVQERKDWIQTYVIGQTMDYRVRSIPYNTFINKELIQFSIYDNERSIPSFVDGFKPSQRKVLFAAFKRNLRSEIKVSQFSGYVSEHSAYHHGDQSLNGTIVGMAQTFVGSNNVNLLYPGGQFGTRLMGGKDAASSRYIFTRLETITRSIFCADDDDVLAYREDDGQSIEPDWYVPIIPMALVNGSDGIGTGWSTSIPNYNPRDLILNIRNAIAGLPMVEIHPWYRGFGGIIREKSRGMYTVHGRLQKTSDTTIEITELPLRRWTQDYKSFLESLMGSEKGSNPKIKELRENHTDTRVHFIMTLTPECMATAEAMGLEKFFHLDGSLAATNMHVFDRDGHIKKYENPLDLIQDFYPIRLEFYGKRKKSMLTKLREELLRLSNRERFILMVINDELVVNKRKVKELCTELKSLGFDVFMPAAKGSRAETGAGGDADLAEEDNSDLVKGYNYLLSMKIQTLTREKVDRIQEEVRGKKREVEVLEATTESSLWLSDLEKLEKGLDEMDTYFQELEKSIQKSRAKAGKRKGASIRRGNGGGGDEFEESDDDDDDDRPRSKSRKSKAKKGESEMIPLPPLQSQTTISLRDLGIDPDTLPKRRPAGVRAASSEKSKKSGAKGGADGEDDEIVMKEGNGGESTESDEDILLKLESDDDDDVIDDDEEEILPRSRGTPTPTPSPPVLCVPPPHSQQALDAPPSDSPPAETVPVIPAATIPLDSSNPVSKTKPPPKPRAPRAPKKAAAAAAAPVPTISLADLSVPAPSTAVAVPVVAAAKAPRKRQYQRKPVPPSAPQVVSEAAAPAASTVAVANPPPATDLSSSDVFRSSIALVPQSEEILSLTDRLKQKMDMTPKKDLWKSLDAIQSPPEKPKRPRKATAPPKAAPKSKKPRRSKDSESSGGSDYESD